MRKLTNKEKLALNEELKVAKVKVLINWDFSNEEISSLLALPITEVNIYVKKYNLREKEILADLV